MDGLNDFFNWAWARHANPLSWYVRPLFILPFCYFAYKRTLWGVVLTIVAVTSSMFWFPAPATPDPRAASLLAVERQYLAEPLTFSRFVLTALIPVWFVTLAWAIRKRSWLGVAAVILSGTLLKVGWLFRVGGSNAWVIVPPVALGTAVCASVLLFAYRRTRHGVLALVSASLLANADLSAQAGRSVSPDLMDLARRGALRIDGRQVSELVDGERRGVRVSAAQNFGIAWVDGIVFATGTIELDVRGKDVQSQSFLGVALSSVNNSTYESVFVRPFNFRTTDPIRRNHAIQYESMPTHPWSRLRSESPEVYENPTDPAPDPNAWVRLRTVVEPTRIHIFVGDGAEPDLTVDRINARPEGRVGLWVGNFSGGDFANLRMIPTERTP
jgi:hypothetical protein